MFSTLFNRLTTLINRASILPSRNLTTQNGHGIFRNLLSNPLCQLQVRWTTYGQEYQPSSLKRKRKFGYLARLRSRGGRKILHRRIMKGRKYLSA